MTDKSPNLIEDRLRHHAQSLRTNSLPLSDLIPLLQAAADEIQKLRSQAESLQSTVSESSMHYLARDSEASALMERVKELEAKIASYKSHFSHSELESLMPKVEIDKEDKKMVWFRRKDVFAVVRAVLEKAFPST